jgi:hypothetical protein
MRVPDEQHAIKRVIERLAELLSFPTTEVMAREMRPTEVDAVADFGSLTFVIEWKGSSSLAQVSRAVDQVREYGSGLGEPAALLVAVPFMGPVGRERCREAGVNWLDLSGNAHITAPGVQVRIEGHPNCFGRPGRPSSAFAPKSSRIARWLLVHPEEPATQREIARATNMDEGFTSRIVARLEEHELVIREPDGAIRVRDPGLLLDAWREDYDFSRHQIVKGHVAARSGEALLREVSEQLDSHEVDYAATGMAAAWLYTRFAGFRIVATYVAELPSSEALGRLGFREEASGANLWLVVPTDNGVFHGGSDRDGVRCVHPVQAYLDLMEQPERSEEAAEHLRAELLTGRADG